jgi:hypothetical protein
LSMLIITVDAQPSVVTLRLSGRLADLEARELARTRIAVGFLRPNQTVVFDLRDLTAVNVVGQEFLAQAHRNGDRLVEGVTSAIVDEIINRPGLENGPSPSSKSTAYDAANDSASTRCTNEIAIEPSPTADATRLMFPHRTSPTANTSGRDVSSR